MGKRLRMANGEVVDAGDRVGEDLLIAPVILLDCEECAGYTDFDHHSATVVECIVCGTEQSNERLTDLSRIDE